MCNNNIMGPKNKTHFGYCNMWNGARDDISKTWQPPVKPN